MQDETITALATKPGDCAVTIIKISGEKSLEIAKNIFVGVHKKKIIKFESYRIYYGKIIDEKNQIIDEVILTVMKQPKSYTREDVVEINCHGGMAAAGMVLDIILKNGARLAQPGEFTKRAFLNGRIDLSQAEAVADLISSKTYESLKIASSNIEGKITKEITEIRKKLIENISDLEASLDFIEEDLQITPIVKIAENINEICKKIKQIIKDEEKGEIIKNGIKVVIAGRPNVGKSSLLNYLLKKDRAIVTHIPGTTRDVLREVIYIQGIPVIISDTAGIRQSKNIIEKMGVDKTFNEISKSDIVIVVVDASKKFEKEDIEIIKKAKIEKVIICINKIDLKRKLKKIDLEELNVNKIVELSVLRNIGIEKLEEEIRKFIFGNNEFNIDEKIIVNKRQKKLLEEAYDYLEKTIESISQNMSEEFLCEDLKRSYNLLGEVIGQTYNDDILNSIFSKFCIGK